jgi:hypothetical protein
VPSSQVVEEIVVNENVGQVEGLADVICVEHANTRTHIVNDIVADSNVHDFGIRVRSSLASGSQKNSVAHLIYIRLIKDAARQEQRLAARTVGK